MPPVGFEPAVPASERPQTHALDPAAMGPALIELNIVTPVMARVLCTHIVCYRTCLSNVPLYCDSMTYCTEFVSVSTQLC